MAFPNIEFHVQSASTGEIYFVNVTRLGANLTCRCTCPAAINGLHCKHRLAILGGNGAGIVGGDISSLEIIPQMLAGTDVEEALRSMLALEEQKSNLEKKLKLAKKNLGRLMASESDSKEAGAAVKIGMQTAKKENEVATHLIGKTILFTGSLIKLSRANQKAIAEHFGAEAAGKIDNRTAFVVRGVDGISDKKLNQAASLGVEIIDENELLRRMAFKPFGHLIPKG